MRKTQTQRSRLMVLTWF